MSRTQHRPPATRVEPVTDTYHGQEIVDPYRWLEEDASEETREWVAAQNAYTRQLLDTLPQRDRIQARLGQLLGIGALGTPVPRGNRAFFTRRRGGENQPRLYVRNLTTGNERVLLDPNAESAEGTLALDWWYPSPDGCLVAYGYSWHGDEESTLHVIDVDSGAVRPDRIPRTRFCSVAWLPDGSGFYYTRHPQPGEVPPGDERYYRRVFRHRLGDDPARDPLVFGEGLPKEAMASVSLSRDGRWLVVTVNHGWSRADVYARDLTEPEAAFVAVTEGRDALFSAEVYDDTVYLLTNLDAPRYRVLAVDLGAPERPWREVIPEPAEATIEGAGIIGGRFVLQLLERATARLAVHALDGAKQAEIPLPGLGSVAGVQGEQDGQSAFFGYEDFTTPPTVYRYDLDPDGGEPEEWARVEAPVDLSSYATEQVWYESRDGTRVSMFIVSREGTPRDGDRPALLTGYGGFNISRTPAFLRGALLWLEAGGVYALPNLRGGGEYGEEWHRAGMLANKQNVFDDFMAAGEYLVRERYTSPERLAILGGSNGGLLVGAALTQRPDLFRAVVCAVPLLDMLRYHRFLIAGLWVAEYGAAENAEQFPFIAAYSPYHRVRDGTTYPAVLLLTAESDTRVAPLHARKMTARLQAASASELPVLLRVETRAGHGAGKPIGKLIEEQTDIWSFLCWQLGVPFAEEPEPRERTEA